MSMTKIPVRNLSGMRGLRGLRGLADDTYNAQRFATVRPTAQEAEAAYQASQSGAPALGFWGSNANFRVYNVGGTLYAVVPYNPPRPRNQVGSGGVPNSMPVYDEQGAYIIADVVKLSPTTSTPSNGGTTTGPDGCPCRTETTTVQKTIVIPVKQTRVICDTPPPTSSVPPCDEVTAAVRSQLNAQGVEGLSGLADGGGIVDLAFKVAVGVGIGYLIWGR